MSRTKVKNSVLGPEFYGTVTALDAAATIDVDFEGASTFTVTPDQNTTFNLQNATAGMVKNIVLTGDGTARTISFTCDGQSGGTYNKIGTTNMDEVSGNKSLLQIVCVGGTTGYKTFWYNFSKASTE